jgi:serine O-acetyltransferase
VELMMRLSTLVSTLKSDLERHWDEDLGSTGNLVSLVQTQGVWATLVYRYGQWVYSGGGVNRVPHKLAYKALNKMVEVTTGVCLPASATIGPGFLIGHFGTIIIHPDTVMGRGCGVSQGVTIGTRGLGGCDVPVFGDNVYIGAGAKVLGGIKVGDNAAIGANAVVVKDVPADNVAVGIPAKTKPRR